VKNQLQAIALSQGVQKKRKLWSEGRREELEQLPLLPYAAARRQQLLATLDKLEQEIAVLNQQVDEEVKQRVAAQRLMTHPEVGPVTAAPSLETG
jgi:transposase